MIHSNISSFICLSLRRSSIAHPVKGGLSVPHRTGAGGRMSDATYLENAEAAQDELRSAPCPQPSVTTTVEPEAPRSCTRSASHYPTTGS